MTESVAKFETVFLERNAPENPNSAELLNWCKRFSEFGLAPLSGERSHGNLSFRGGKGMIITASGNNLGNCSENELVEVIECEIENFSVKVVGLSEPSSETFIHWEIYKRRPELNAIFHGHSELILKHAAELGIPVTENFAKAGTIELLKEIIDILNENKMIVAREHGFFSMGASMEEAGKIALEYLERAKELEE
ncbi:MAG: class II aldolase/adducin family protein [Candidatus Diapherotrites archaeon]